MSTVQRAGTLATLAVQASRRQFFTSWQSTNPGPHRQVSLPLYFRRESHRWSKTASRFAGIWPSITGLFRPSPPVIAPFVPQSRNFHPPQQDLGQDEEAGTPEPERLEWIKDPAPNSFHCWVSLPGTLKSTKTDTGRSR